MAYRKEGPLGMGPCHIRQIFNTLNIVILFFMGKSILLDLPYVIFMIYGIRIYLKNNLSAHDGVAKRLKMLTY